MKLLYHPTYTRYGGSDGLDNRRTDMGRRWADRRCYIRKAETLNEAKRENRFMWKWLFWEIVVIGIIILCLAPAYSCEIDEPEPVDIRITGAL